MKKIFFLAIMAVAALANVNAQTSVQPYLTTKQLPNLIKCLPAPPDTIGEHFAHDIMRYFWGKQQRLDPERAAIARRDAVWSYEALFAEFNVPFGLTISKTETPEIWKLLETSLVTTDQMRVEPKAFYKRMRPYVRFHEHILTYDAEEDEVELGREGSYPSGHTMRGWTTALLLAEINPAAQDAILLLGYEWGQSRVILGYHWQSDVDASRMLASACLARMHTSADFMADVAAAREEYARLSGQTEQAQE